MNTYPCQTLPHTKIRANITKIAITRQTVDKFISILHQPVAGSSCLLSTTHDYNVSKDAIGQRVVD